MFGQELSNLSVAERGSSRLSVGFSRAGKGGANHVGICSHGSLHTSRPATTQCYPLVHIKIIDAFRVWGCKSAAAPEMSAPPRTLWRTREPVSAPGDGECLAHSFLRVNRTLATASSPSRFAGALGGKSANWLEGRCEQKGRVMGWDTERPREATRRVLQALPGAS